MSLLTWERPRLSARMRWPRFGAAQKASSQTGNDSDALTPLRMTIVGALLIAIGPLSMSLYTPALTLLTGMFTTTEAAIRGTITLYLFGFACAQLICGPLSDRFGRRPVLIGCLCLYILGAAIGGIAGSVGVLTAGRLIQGIGACGGVALSRVMVVDRFAGNGAARIISLMSLILSIAPALAPILGGGLITVMSWRYLFLLMVLYGAGLLALVWWFPETNTRRDPRATKLRSLAVNYATLLTSRKFISQVALTSLTIGGLYTSQALVPFVLMGRLGLSSPMFGLVTSSLMVAYLIGSLVTNRLLTIFSTTRLVVAGAVMVLLASLDLGLGLRLFGLGVIEVIAPLCLWMLGMAFIMPGVTTGALVLFPKNAGSASALMGCLQMGMGFVGTASSALFADTVMAFSVVPPVLGVAGVVVYLAANRKTARPA
jgi:DHA1 family bicyclomycin/chloramphenicol resistance-like MFS transporter